MAARLQDFSVAKQKTLIAQGLLPTGSSQSQLECGTKSTVSRFHRQLLRPVEFGRANVLAVSRTAGPECRGRRGTAVAAEELRSHDWRTATAMTPSRFG